LRRANWREEMRWRRQDENDDVGLRKQTLKFADGLDWRIFTRCARHAQKLDTEWNEHSFYFFADCSVTHKQNRFARELLLHHGRIMRARIAGDASVVLGGFETPFPLARPLDIKVEGKIFQHRKDCGKSPFGGRDVVCPAGITNRDMGSHGARNPLGTGHERQNQPHAAEMRHNALGSRWIGIGNPDIDFDVVVELVGQRDKLDFLGETGEEVSRNGCGDSHS
jgi:hypothetical protein